MKKEEHKMRCFISEFSVVLIILGALVKNSTSPGPEMSSRHPDPVSSHVLDTSGGYPAKNIRITMFKGVDSCGKTWIELASK